MAGTITRRRADAQAGQPGSPGAYVTLFTFGAGLSPEPGGMLNALLIANKSAATLIIQFALVESGGSQAAAKLFYIQIAGQSVIRFPIGLYCNSSAFLQGQIQATGVSGDVNVWVDAIEET